MILLLNLEYVSKIFFWLLKKQNICNQECWSILSLCVDLKIINEVVDVLKLDAAPVKSETVDEQHPTALDNESYSQKRSTFL